MFHSPKRKNENAAEAFGLPLLPPYLGITRMDDARKGANFAVAGATALDPEFFYARNIGSLLWTNDSLSVQLSWFKKVKSALCLTKQGHRFIYQNYDPANVIGSMNLPSCLGCKRLPVFQIECDCYFQKSLFVAGEIGGNDYNYPFFAGASIAQVQPLVPLVVSKIIDAIGVSRA